MDYRYYQGEPLIRLPKWMQKHVPWLRHIGIGFCVLSLVIPMLIITHVTASTFFLNCLAFALNFYGIVLWVYGHSLNRVRQMKEDELSAEILEFYERKRKQDG